VTNIAPVGTATLGAGVWGQLDLAGDVSEWILDADPAYVDPGTDCAYLNAASGRVTRGGSFDEPFAALLQPSTRGSALPTRNANSFELGLRCARTP
jgi:formylglycine-generating enzyme